MKTFMTVWYFFINLKTLYQVLNTCTWTATSNFDNWDHVYFVHPSTDISVDISTDSQHRPIYWLTLDRYVRRHIYRHSADISTEIKLCRSTYRLIYRSIVAQHSTDMSVDMSTESGCLIVGRHVHREATDISLILHWYFSLATGDCTLRRRRTVT